MKNLEKLKIEQVELKEKLLKLIDFLHTDEFASLNSTEKGLLTNQRVGMEIYLNALTQRIYGANEVHMDSMLPMLMMSMFSSHTSPFPQINDLSDNDKDKFIKQENDNSKN